MDELFLHYIWRYQLFRIEDLSTVDGERLTIIEPGIHNHDSGPDFQDAKVKRDGLIWVGKIEIHIKSSDWYIHNHQHDRNYDNVILHVVWENDRNVALMSGERIPTLVLKGRVEQSLITKSKKLTNSPHEIPCAESNKTVDHLQKMSMVSRTLVDRLEQKSEDCFRILKKTGGNWEETTYQLVAKAFGVHLNQENFQRLAEHLPLRIIRKHAGDSHRISALFYGQAGFLDQDDIDEFHGSLREEYQFLSRKYGLTPAISRFQWRFHRMRPTNFPTRRIAMLSRLLSEYPHLFEMIKDGNSVSDKLKQELTTDLAYWKDHYDFGKKSGKTKLGAGVSFINGIIINAFSPILAAASKYFGDRSLMDRAVGLLEESDHENNRITRAMMANGFQNENAADSQGLIHLYRQYCTKKRCLACNIGVTLLRTK